MTRRSTFLGIAILAAAAVTTATAPTQCLQQPGQNPRISVFGEVVYKTLPADTPYLLAERFYGHGYMEYKIRHRNPLFLTSQGCYMTGTEIVIPPDDRGVPIDVTRYQRKPAR